MLPGMQLAKNFRLTINALQPDRLQIDNMNPYKSARPGRKDFDHTHTDSGIQSAFNYAPICNYVSEKISLN